MALPTLKDNEIIQAIKTRFEAITQGTEYNFTPEKVYDNFPDAAAIEKDKLYILNIRETNETLNDVREGPSYPLQDIRFTVLIDIITRGYTAAQVRKIKSDIYKSIGQDDTWGGLAIQTYFVNARRNGRDAYENVISDWSIEIDIVYRKNEWSL